MVAVGGFRCCRGRRSPALAASGDPACPGRPRPCAAHDLAEHHGFYHRHFGSPACGPRDRYNGDHDAAVDTAEAATLRHHSPPARLPALTGSPSLSHGSDILRDMKRLVDLVRSLHYREPARLLGGLAAAATAVAAVLDKGDVHTWQAVLPVLLAEAIRRVVSSPETTDFLVDSLLADDDLA